MTDVPTMEMQCVHCRHWFRSPWQLDPQTFDGATILGNKARCPKCQQMVAANKDNVRWRTADGGFVGEDTTK